MAKFSIPRLVGKTNKAGVTSWYWQPSKTLRARGWEPRRLGASAGGHPLEAVAEAARILNAAVDRPPDPEAAAPSPLMAAPRPPADLTLSQGIARYREAGYPSVKRPGAAVAAATRKQYRSKFRTLEAWGGDVRLRLIDAARVAALREALMAPVREGPRAGDVRHHHAHETLRVGRALFAWFEQQRLLPKGANPFADFALAAPPPRDAIWWPPAREAVIDAAEREEDAGMALAIDLAFQIGQREADLLHILQSQYAPIPPYKMNPDVLATLRRIPVPAYRGRPAYVPDDVKGIRIRQRKTRRWVEVPVVGLTRARVEHAIAEAQARGLATLLFDRARGLPWTMPTEATGQKYFIWRFAALREAAIAASEAAGDNPLAAEIAALQYRDFRRTAVVHMAELGLDVLLIVTITGHDIDEATTIIDTYCPRTTGQAARAIALRAERDQSSQSDTLSRAEGKSQ